MYCTRCGERLEDDAKFCTSCGTRVEEHRYDYFSQKTNPTSSIVSRDGNLGFGFIGFFIPMVGLVLFLCWKNERPKDAKYAGIGALISFILLFVLILLVVLAFSLT